jgi:hypothetical protein
LPDVAPGVCVSCTECRAVVRFAPFDAARLAGACFVAHAMQHLAAQGLAVLEPDDRSETSQSC